MFLVFHGRSAVASIPATDIDKCPQVHSLETELFAPFKYIAIDGRGVECSAAKSISGKTVILATIAVNFAGLDKHYRASLGLNKRTEDLDRTRRRISGVEMISTESIVFYFSQDCADIRSISCFIEGIHGGDISINNKSGNIIIHNNKRHLNINARVAVVDSFDPSSNSSVYHWNSDPRKSFGAAVVTVPKGGECETAPPAEASPGHLPVDFVGRPKIVISKDVHYISVVFPSIDDKCYEYSLVAFDAGGISRGIDPKIINKP